MSNSPVSRLTLVEVAMEIAFPHSLLQTLFKKHGFRPAREAAMSTSVGGIGPLLRDRIIAQSQKDLNVIGVSLLYDTTWIQTWFDWGQLHLEKSEVASFIRPQLQPTGITLPLPMFSGETAEVRVWLVAYGNARVYFLDCPAITHVVYPSEEDAPPKTVNPGQWAADMRNQQSWLIGRGTLALLKTLNEIPDFIIQSETPTFFAHHRLAFDAFHDDPFFGKTRYIFNDHTPMEYAHPIWGKQTLDQLKVDSSLYKPPVSGSPKNREDIDITRLLVGISDGVFGVSQKHGQVMRAMPSLKDYAAKIGAITNGVALDPWQSPDYAQSLSLSDEQLLTLAAAKKTDLLDWIWRHFGLWHTWKDQVKGKAVALWTRRITGYKRLDLLGTICKDPSMKRQFLESDIVLLIGGRIHQHDDQAQTMIYHLLDLISVDKALQERIIMLDNFNVWMAPRIFQGADAAIMLADDGREASATGFMKAQMNGGLIIATDDGAIPESVIFTGKEKPGQTANGFEVPYVNGHPTPEGLLNALKALHQTVQNPAQWAAMKRSTLGSQSQISIDRTVKETLEFLALLKAPSSVQPIA